MNRVSPYSEERDLSGVIRTKTCDRRVDANSDKNCQLFRIVTSHPATDRHAADLQS